MVTRGVRRLGIEYLPTHGRDHPHRRVSSNPKSVNRIKRKLGSHLEKQLNVGDK
jgi:hypothetical protein